MKNIVILTSGRGPNMEAIVRACQIEGRSGRIAAVVPSRSETAGLKFTTSYGITTAVVDRKAFPDYNSFDAALAQVIDDSSPDLAVLAGFVRILTTGFITRYIDRILDIYPSLLSCFLGLHTHGTALAMDVKAYGATVHSVTADLDHSPIVLQVIIDVHQSDAPSPLAGRLLAQGHTAYPHAMCWPVGGQLSVEDGVIRVSPGESQLVIGVDAREAV